MQALKGYQSLFGSITEQELEKIQESTKELETMFLQFQIRRGYDQEKKPVANTRNIDNGM